MKSLGSLQCELISFHLSENFPTALGLGAFTCRFKLLGESTFSDLWEIGRLVSMKVMIVLRRSKALVKF